MYNNKPTLWMLLWMGLAVAILTGCGAKGQPAEFNQTAGEMKEGPGVFTGEEGALVIYDSKKGGGLLQRFKEKSEETAKAESEKTSEAADKNEKEASDKTLEATQIAADQTSTETQVTPEAAREFQEFQEWKKEQKEFEEFQEWKKTSKGAAEYKEFLEWKEWKSYQEWKKQQGQ
jgi:hypothetical protein